MKSISSYIDPFDRTTGNGSRNSTDDWTDENSIYDNEWGSEAATTFNPREASAHNVNKFEKFYKIQNGKGNSTRSITIKKTHIKNDMNTFMNVLELPKYQRERIEYIIDNLDLSSNNFGSVKYEKIILSVCSLVSDEALSNSHDPDVNDRLFLSDEFKHLMEVTEMSSSEHRKIRVSVREKSDYFD